MHVIAYESSKKKVPELLLDWRIVSPGAKMQFLPLHASVDSFPFSREGKVRYFQCDFLHFSTKITYFARIRPFLGTSPPLGQVHCIKEPSITGKSESTLSLLHQLHFFPLPFFSGAATNWPQFRISSLSSPPFPIAPLILHTCNVERGTKEEEEDLPNQISWHSPQSEIL